MRQGPAAPQALAETDYEVDYQWGRSELSAASGLIHSGDSQIARSSSSSRHESRNCRQRHAGRSPSA